MRTGIAMIPAKPQFCNMCKSDCGGHCNNLVMPAKMPDLCFNSAVNRHLFETELKEWEVLLTALKQENGILILKLSLLVDDNSGREFLSRAEYFHNEFITRDEYVQELEKDIIEQFQIMKDGQKLMLSFSKKHDKLRNEINAFAKNYESLKSEFGNYLLDKE